MTDIAEYQLEPGLSATEFIDLLRRSTLAERRPVDDAAVMAGMLAHADLIVTARLAGTLVGVSRAITDFSYCTYLADLAVAAEQQGRGIGRELIRRTHEAAGLHTTLILLAAGGATAGTLWICGVLGAFGKLQDRLLGLLIAAAF